MLKRVLILHLILLLAVNALSCGQYSANEKIITEAEKKLLMEADDINNKAIKRINLQTVSFLVPDEFEDESISSNFIKLKYSDDGKKRLVGSELERVSATRFMRGKEISDGKDAAKVTDIESARKSFHIEIEGLKKEAKNLYGVGSLTIKIESLWKNSHCRKKNFRL